jgi:hypothetical protein
MDQKFAIAKTLSELTHDSALEQQKLLSVPTESSVLKFQENERKGQVQRS